MQSTSDALKDSCLRQIRGNPTEQAFKGGRAQLTAQIKWKGLTLSPLPLNITMHIITTKRARNIDTPGLLKRNMAILSVPAMVIRVC